MKYNSLFLILVLLQSCLGQDAEDLLEGIETGTEEGVTEVDMEDVTMTTPITTPAAAKVTSQKEILTTPVAEEEDNIESEKEVILKEESLEMNQDTISGEKIPKKLSITVDTSVNIDEDSDDTDDNLSDDYNEVESRSNKDDIGFETKTNSNGWFYFSDSHPGLVPLYQTVLKFPASPKHVHPQPYIPKFQWSYPYQWASKPTSDQDKTNTIGSSPFTFPYVYYSINTKVGVDNNQNV